MVKKLYEEGLIGKADTSLPDSLLVHNFRQEGYISGLWSGYAIAMMSLVNNAAPEGLIISVRDEMRPYMLGHTYKTSSEFSDKYKDEKYIWVEKLEAKNGGNYDRETS